MWCSGKLRCSRHFAGSKQSAVGTDVDGIIDGILDIRKVSFMWNL